MFRFPQEQQTDMGEGGHGPWTPSSAVLPSPGRATAPWLSITAPEKFRWKWWT